MEIYGLAHIGIYVRELEASRRFYEEILGFETIWSFINGGTPIAFVRCGDCVLELIQTKADRVDGRVDHVAFSVRNIEAVCQTLLDRGVVFEADEITTCPACFPNGSRWLMFRGPDGERLEISEAL